MKDRVSFQIDFPRLKRGSRILLKDVCFGLKAGGYIELLGPNGSGKTSLLRTIAGLGDDNPTLDNHQIFYYAHLAGFRQELTVSQQLLLSLEMMGVKITSDEVTVLLEKVQLQRQQHVPVANLSHGQSRRLFLAIMYQSGRPVWLIDEPFNALDNQAKDLLAELLIAHFKRGGMALISTHFSVDQTLPILGDYKDGVVTLHNQQAMITLTTEKSETIGLGANAHGGLGGVIAMTSWRSFIWSLKREVKLLFAKPTDALWPAVFFTMVGSLFPLAIGAKPQVLTEVAHGIFWMSALLAVLLGAGRMYSEDAVCGAIEQMRVASVSLPAASLGKIIGNAGFVGLPLMVATILLSMLYQLPMQVLPQLAIAMVLGFVSLYAVVGIFAALGLMTRQAQVMMSVLAVPIFVPVLIFGSAASSANSYAPMWVLLALAVLSLLVAPIVMAKVLVLATD